MKATCRSAVQSLDWLVIIGLHEEYRDLAFASSEIEGYVGKPSLQFPVEVVDIRVLDNFSAWFPFDPDPVRSILTYPSCSLILKPSRSSSDGM